MGGCLVIIIEPTTRGLLIMHQTPKPPPSLRSNETARTARKHITREQFRKKKTTTVELLARIYELKINKAGGGGWGGGGGGEDGSVLVKREW